VKNLSAQTLKTKYEEIRTLHHSCGISIWPRCLSSNDSMYAGKPRKYLCKVSHVRTWLRTRVTRQARQPVQSTSRRVSVMSLKLDHIS